MDLGIDLLMRTHLMGVLQSLSGWVVGKSSFGLLSGLLLKL